jgi:C4-dicarboxylate-specific signal transduction histidine kinase
VSPRDFSDTDALDLEMVTDAMRRIAAGDFSARLPRSGSGDGADVLAFLVNALAEEVGALVEELRREREELRTAKDRMVETEKLAALGLLAGGVAHEVNQPLSVIRSLTELLTLSADEPISSHLEDLQMIESATARITRIVDSVRTFGRGQPFRLRDTVPSEPVADALVLLSDPLRQAGIQVEVHPAPNLPVIRADAERLEQVFVNLIANARDALESRPIDSRHIEIAISCEAGWVRYDVTDSGPGISEDVRGHVFEPFFTTKTPTRGTGLGLSVSLGIVGEHRGTLGYEPAPDGRSRFVVRIPQVTSGKRSHAG